MLSVSDIYVNYGSSQVLHGVSLEVSRGEVVAVVGRNGVGKTTLLRAIMGLTPAHLGSIDFNGRKITRLPAHKIARLGIGYVPQGRRVFPSLNVREHLTIAERGGGASRWTLSRVCEMFPNLKERLGQSGAKLSGGEQEMLALGRALVTNPALFIMDEPTEGLAPLMVREVGRLLQDLKNAGTPVLLVEQQLSFVLKFADRVYVMAKGQIVHQCTGEQLARDEDLKSRYLGV